jgi:hypothetical protein
MMFPQVTGCKNLSKYGRSWDLPSATAPLCAECAKIWPTVQAIQAARNSQQQCWQPGRVADIRISGDGGQCRVTGKSFARRVGLFGVPWLSGARRWGVSGRCRHGCVQHLFTYIRRFWGHTSEQWAARGPHRPQKCNLLGPQRRKAARSDVQCG